MEEKSFVVKGFKASAVAAGLRKESGLDLTLIFISHDLSVVRYIADRIAVMEHGRIVEGGAANAVFDHPQGDCARILLSAVPKIRW
jgi:ABC-type glutathione transport system ATPase component